MTMTLSTTPGGPPLPPLDDGTLDPDPIVQFKQWFDVAAAAGIKLPDAVTLATASKEGRPSARMVLLKHVDAHGFVFYSNYQSRKGRELEENPYAALVVYWSALDRQVRVEGRVSKISPEESDAYFSTRPRDAQLSSHASAQSARVKTRADLDAEFEELQKVYEGKSIPRPEHWGGYRLSPAAIEFWQQRFSRLNDRILYERKANGSWSMKRLAP